MTDENERETQVIAASDVGDLSALGVVESIAGGPEALEQAQQVGAEPEPLKTYPPTRQLPCADCDGDAVARRADGKPLCSTCLSAENDAAAPASTDVHHHAPPHPSRRLQPAPSRPASPGGISRMNGSETPSGRRSSWPDGNAEV